MTCYQWDDQDLLLAIYVQPRASQAGISGMHGDRLKVKITAPPVEGKANAEVCKLFAQLCGVAKSQVEIISGTHSREKRLRIRAPKTLPDGLL